MTAVVSQAYIICNNFFIAIKLLVHRGVPHRVHESKHVCTMKKQVISCIVFLMHFIQAYKIHQYKIIQIFAKIDV